MKELDITTITTVEKLNAVDFNPFKSETLDHSWVKHIKYPATRKEFNRLTILSLDPRSKVICADHMGDLYVYDKKVKEPCKPNVTVNYRNDENFPRT